MKKIMFNDRFGLEAGAINGRKTMTRRIATYDEIKNPQVGFLTDQPERGTCVICDGCRIVAKSLYKLGEIVAIAQSYEVMANSGYLNLMMEGPATFKKEYTGAGWSNKMFVRADLMPHQIQFTDIKAERLQDISDEDCIKEGIYFNPNPPKWREYDPYEPWPPHVKPYKFTTIHGYCKPQYAFSHLINAISGKDTWERNPWVFVYSYKLIK